MKKILEANVVVSGVFAMCSALAYVATQSVITGLIAISIALLVIAFITRSSMNATIMDQTLELFGKTGLAAAFFLFSFSINEPSGIGIIATIVIAIMFTIHSIKSCHEIAVNAKRNGAPERLYQLFLVSVPVAGLVVGEAILLFRQIRREFWRMQRPTH